MLTRINGDPLVSFRLECLRAEIAKALYHAGQHVAQTSSGPFDLGRVGDLTRWRSGVRVPTSLPFFVPPSFLPVISYLCS